MDDGTWKAVAPSMPEVTATGETATEAVQNLRQKIQHLVDGRPDGGMPPARRLIA